MKALLRHSILRASWIVGACCLALVLLPGACDCTRRPTKPLRIGLAVWIGHAPILAAVQRGVYSPDRVETRTFAGAYDLIRAFREKRLDLMGVGMFDVLRMQDQRIPFEIVLALNYSNGADGIVARESVTSLEDLRGKRVSAEIGGVNHFILSKALRRAGMTDSDVVIVNRSIEAGFAALENGEVDAATLCEPFLSRARAHGARVLYTTAEDPGEILDVIVAQPGLSERRKSDVQHFLQGWDEMLASWRKSPREVEELMSWNMGMTLEEFRLGAMGLTLLDLAGNRRVFDEANPSSIQNVYEHTARFMAEHHLLKRPAPPRAPVASRHAGSRRDHKRDDDRQ